MGIKRKRFHFAQIVIWVMIIIYKAFIEMLRAILHSKDRKIKIAEETSINFRESYRDIEDFLTATIFSRLCYLEGSIWTELFEVECGDLEAREFWPRWKNDPQGLSQTEPDLFLRFEKCDIIIEAKRYDGWGQKKEQIEREIEAYKREYPKEEKTFYLFMLGGGGKNIIVKECYGNKVKSFEWQDLFEKVRNSCSVNKFIKDDLMMAFELHGIREKLFLKDLLSAKNIICIADYTKHIEYLSEFRRVPSWRGFDRIAQITINLNSLEFLKWK